MMKRRTSAEGKTDLRVVKTRAALVQALRELLAEKGIDRITVLEICERAQVRKATFYTHFRDKEDLFVYLVTSIRDGYIEQMDAAPSGCSTVEYCSNVFALLLEFLEDNDELASEVMRTNTRNLALDTLMKETANDLRSRLEQEQAQGAKLPGRPAFLATMCTGAIVNAARWWVEEKPRPTRQEATREFAATLAHIGDDAEG